jgi:hypothetical protein
LAPPAPLDIFIAYLAKRFTNTCRKSNTKEAEEAEASATLAAAE